MTIPFACSCGKSFRANDEFAGKRTKCPACGQVLVIPQAPPKETDSPAENAVEKQPRSKKHAARPRSRALLIGMGVIALLIVGAGGGAAYWWLIRPSLEAGKPIVHSPTAVKATQNVVADEPDPADQVDLGEDLKLVPRDAVGFAAVRVSDWMASPLVQQLRKHPLALVLPDPDKEMERAVGLKPADIERVTFVLPVINIMENWTLVLTRKPYDQARILQLLGRSEERQVGSKKYHYVEAQQWAVHFVNDHLLVVGTDEGVRMFLTPSPPNSRGMSAGLILAATKRHHMTACLKLPPIILGALVPEELRPFEAVLNTTGVILTVDAADGLDLNAQVNYADEAAATKAEQAAKELLQWGRTQLANLKKEWSQGPDGAVWQPVFQLVDPLVQTIPISRQGRTVEVRCQVDAKTVASAAVYLVPAIQRMRTAADRTQTPNNLKQLALAMHNYHDAKGQFPPAVVRAPDGRPLYSWRVELLPFLDHKALYDEFKKDEPWDSPHNRPLLAKMPAVFALEGVPSKEPGSTFYQVLVGPGTPFGGKKPLRLPKDFPGGTSNTLLIVTAAEAVPWTKPADLAYDPTGPLPKLGRQSSAGTPVAFADGSVRMLEPTLDEKALRALIAPPGGSGK